LGELETKQQGLVDQLTQFPSVIVAHLGGVDSAYLACAADRAPGGRMLPVIALSASYSERDRQDAEAVVARFNLPHEFTTTDEFSSPAYRANNPDRCCFWKD
jgi:uncharacterized protein